MRRSRDSASREGSAIACLISAFFEGRTQGQYDKVLAVALPPTGFPASTSTTPLEQLKEGG